MDRALKIIGDSEGLQDFLAEWFSDSPYIIAHTSGSTGEPKEIRLLKTDMMESAQATCRFFDIDMKSVLYLPLSVGYIAGKMMVIRALVSGATLIVEHPSNNPLQTLDCGYPVSLMAVVPSQLPALMKNPLISHVRNLIVGGAPLSPAQERDVAVLSTHVYATYGMTETCSHVALRDISKGSDVYEALPDVTFSTDSRNCLRIMCQRMSFIELQTNDVVDLLSATSFRWLGRYDNVINSGGIKLHPEILEKKLHEVIGQPFYLTGKVSEKWGQELVLVVKAPADVQKIMDKTAEVLYPFEKPKEVIVVDELPITTTGKIRRILPRN